MHSPTLNDSTGTTPATNSNRTTIPPYPATTIPPEAAPTATDNADTDLPDLAPLPRNIDDTPDEDEAPRLAARQPPIDDTTDDEEAPRLAARQAPNLNTTNLRTNVVYGQDMVLPKPDDITRLISLNIHGIRRVDDYQDVLETAQAFKTSSVDMASLSETNIDWRSVAKSKFYEKFRRIYHKLRISTSSSTIKYTTNYQPGGTLTMLTDKYTGRVTGTGDDSSLGRWSYIEILGRGRTILLVTVYNVCQQHGNQAGSRTAHTQQASLLLREGRKVSPPQSLPRRL
jgi:hypothetical protein